MAKNKPTNVAEQEETKTIFTDKKSASLFDIKRKPIVPHYSSLEETRRYIRRGQGSLFNRANTKDLSSFYNSSYLDPYFKNPGSKLIECVDISKTLYATNRIYQGLIDYLTSMYYWRAVTTPRLIKASSDAKLKKAEYMVNYKKMLEVTEGFNISVAYPQILKEIFLTGQVFLYATADKKSKTVSVLLLPPEYCSTSIATQYGTTMINFDMSLFDVLGSTDEEKKTLFSVFPEEFRALYEKYRESGRRMQLLNPKVSTCIRMNESGFPTFLSIFYDIIDYKTYKLNELDRSTNALERILSQEIDLEKTGIELPEVKELHDSIADIIDGNGTTTLTSVGKLDVLQLQEEKNQENKALANAYKSIFDNAGFNNALFSSDSVEALKVSIKRDMNYVWNYIEKIVNFYNLAANNLYSFDGYQLSFRVLPISPYDEKEKLELYRNNATLGVGVVDLIVASGIKQVDIESTLELEENLNLVSRLMPLQSSHTQSLTPGSSSTERREENEQAEDEVKEQEEEQKVSKAPNDKSNQGKKSTKSSVSNKE